MNLKNYRYLLFAGALLNLIYFPLGALPRAHYDVDIFADIDRTETLPLQHKSLFLTENPTSTSIFLDSPSSATYQRVTPLILETNGTVQLKEANLDKKRKKVKFWNLPGKIYRIFEENDALATQLEMTPIYEQYAIATKLAEYSRETLDDETSPACNDIASPEMLSNIKFLTKTSDSILKKTSRLSTIGGEISITALLSKCSDNIPVIQERQKFIKYLVDNPELLHTLKEKLTVIKNTEPMFFSNYRPFKKERLKIIIKGDTIKKIAKKISRSKEMDRFATSIEVKWYPLILFVLGTLFTIENTVDLIRSFFKDGEFISNPGMRPFKIFRSLGKLGAPFFRNIINQKAMKNSWKKFLSPKNPLGPLTTTNNQTQVLITPPQQNFIQKILGTRDSIVKANFKSLLFPDSSGIYIKPTADTQTIAANQIDRYDQWLDTTVKSLNSEMDLTPKESFHLSKLDTSKQSDQAATDKTAAEWREHQTNGVIKKMYLEQETNKIYNKLGVLFFLGGIFAFFPKIEFELKALLAKYLDIKNLFTSVQAPVKTYTTAQEIYDLLGKNESTAHLFLPVIQRPSPAWKNFLELTKGSTFSSDFNIFTLITKDIGSIFQAYTNLMQCREEMSSLIKFYGEVDAYVSMALLVKEHENTTNTFGAITTFCYVDFVDECKYPVFDAQDFWNPSLTPQEAVTNTLSIGEKENCRNLIFTGAHAGGKTTTLMAILASILMAQTFGIAPAKSLTLSPFSYIFENLKNESSGEGKLSRFQSEAFKFVSIYHQLLTIPSTKRCAVFFDESLSGTETGPASEIIKKSSEALVQMPNIFSAFSTHNKEITELEQETDGAFKNFKVEVVKMPDGKLYRPYKLTQGVGESITAYDVFFEAMQKQGIKNPQLAQIIIDAQAAQEEKDRKNEASNIFTSDYFF
ncbi:hypothetical protein FJ366_02560 [Candidatus Dependentiae bacterium]|nr:hypothetical protein [Candidatus Dependentiae bacterium]